MIHFVMDNVEEFILGPHKFGPPNILVQASTRLLMQKVFFQLQFIFSRINVVPSQFGY